MSTRTRAASRLTAIAGGIAIVSAATAFPAVAADGDVQVVNTETVKAYTDATGTVTDKKLYEQLVLTGDGAVEVANPVETAGLRNLDGFSGFDVEDGDQLVEVEVDGHENLRSVSSYDEDLPLDISVDYVLDGEPISPKSLVGKSGDLEVTYTVRNDTTRNQTITYTDGKGGTVEETAEVMMPMVGSLATTLPPSFRDVEAGGASAAGDGKGGTKLSYTMTLLAPLGSDVVELGYTAEVEDAVAPPASVSALPVNPLDNPTLSNAAKSYKGGADTGEKLAAGASEIDANLLKLRDGASDLLAGLIKLRNGADQLSDGLKNEAAPGARKLADGAGDLNDGLGQLDDGAGRLADGTEDLRDGTGQLADGAGRLDDGAGKLSDGANKAGAGSQELAAGLEGLLDGMKQLRDGVDALPQTVRAQINADPKFAALLGALQKVIDGIGTPTDSSDQTLLGGLNLIKGGVTQKIDPGVKEIQTKLAAGSTSITKAGGLLDAANGAYSAISALRVATGQDACLGFVNVPLADGSMGKVPNPGNLQLAADNPCRAAAAAALGYGAPKEAPFTSVPGLENGGFAKAASDAAAGLGQISYGLTNENPEDGVKSVVEGIDGLKGALYNAANCDMQTGQNCGIAQVLMIVQQGVDTAIDTILTQIEGTLLGSIGTRTVNCDPEKTLLCATGALEAGSGELAVGLGDLADGAGQLADGTGELNDGVGRLDAGANKLADGAGELKGGTAKAEAGSLLIANGAFKLADGLIAAAGGSGLLADGLATAAEGAPKLVDGAQRLSDEGTKKLVEAGEATAQDYGKQYSLIMAGAERAQDGKMVVGAPEEAVGLAAYSFEIQGEDGEGNRNLARALGGLGLLGAGAGLFALRRRFI